MVPDADLLILGGGCAGLSLARELAALGPRAPSTCIVEQRAAYANDRTWCFWGEPGDPLARLVERQWSAVSLCAGARRTTVDFTRHPYQMISGRRFYDDALATIATAPRIRLETGIRITAEPRRENGLWHLDTDAGSRSARRLVDTRPGAAPGIQDRSPLLWQSFLGYEITCDVPIFDPDTVTLMDFIDEPAHPIAFTYLLPMSATRALIEVTVFSPEPVKPAGLALPLRRQLRARLGRHGFTVERAEHGMLPMGLTLAKNLMSGHTDHLQVGLMHGGARASTGYAFQRIQHWARGCARRIADGAPLAGHPRDPLVMRGMDRLFLSVLRNRPELGPALFMAMFQHTEPDTLVRFMNDRASLADTFAIIAALPAMPFLGQLGRSLVPAA